MTNLEYRQFVEAGGYEERTYWTAEGWDWIRNEAIHFPRYWLIPELNCPNAPVVGVSLYEAMAYCRWLGDRVSGSAGSVAPFHLPTPEQWDRALGLADTMITGILRMRKPAAPSVGFGRQQIRNQILSDVIAHLDRALRDYDRWMVDREGGFGHQNLEGTPVGLFPPNENGCHDMLGRVWEWCSASEQESSINEPALVKGGPLKDRRGAVWSVLGGFFAPRVRFHQIGFRVCYDLQMSLQ